MENLGSKTTWAQVTVVFAKSDDAITEIKYTNANPLESLRQTPPNQS
jgi:hypothetical protein